MTLADGRTGLQQARENGTDAFSECATDVVSDRLAAFIQRRNGLTGVGQACQSCSQGVLHAFGGVRA